jgi:hypothetical protein
MAVGALMVALCGLCSLALLVGIIQSNLENMHYLKVVRLAAVMGTLLTVSIFGGIPIAIGVAVFIAGLKRYRKPGR